MAPLPKQSVKLPLSRGQIILRICGGILLTACAIMVALGMTIFNERLRGLQFVYYWTGCLLITFGAMILALWDMLLVRRTLKQTRRELFEHEFMNRELVNKLSEKKGR